MFSSIYFLFFLFISILFYLKLINYFFLYFYICKFIFYLFNKDGIGSQTTVNIVIPYPDGEEFQATGLMVLERNWLDVYSKWEKWTGNKVYLLFILICQLI